MSAASPLEVIPGPERGRRTPTAALGWGAAELHPRRNGLNLLRLILALVVLVNHGWTLSGHGEGVLIDKTNFGRWAVYGFFAISGYLITGSRLTKPLSTYIVHRAARIFPAFLVCLVVTAFIFAPIGYWHVTGGLDGFLTTPTTPLNYVIGNAGLRVASYDVAGTPAGVPYPGAWNGSLWSLYYEFLCYLIIAGLCCITAFRRNAVWLTLTFVAVALLNYAMPTAAPFTQSNVDVAFLGNLLPFFLGGGLVYMLRRRIPLTWPLALLSVLVSALIVWRTDGGGAQFAAPLLAYAIVWLGAVLPCPDLIRRHDVSYGVYIYAFPVQQLLATFALFRWGIAAYVALTIAITGVLAVTSWLVIERPVMRRARAITTIRVPDALLDAAAPGSVSPASSAAVADVLPTEQRTPQTI
ncbi:acyltransferase family protein [Cellulomonas sp. ICMP 17802]|uniref:acyltransferase family protein n=1 Tax=Cellulomonas sp. ICMP 17802 TaxID=3239199 RepID=UPI00351B9077